jgi:hypothetical protein
MENLSKVCAKCREDKPLSDYNKLSRASDGKHYRCKECCNAYYKELYPRFREKKIVTSKQRYSRNSEQIKEKVREYAKNHKEQIDEYNKQWRADNADYVRIKSNENEKKRYNTIPFYKALKQSRKHLRKSLGSVTNDGLSVDHKIPISWFLTSTPIEVINHQDNLQLLPLDVNVKKGNKYAAPVSLSFYLMVKKYIKPKHQNKLLIQETPFYD